MTELSIKFKNGEVIPLTSAEDSISGTINEATRRLTLVISNENDITMEKLQKTITADNIDPITISQDDVSNELTGFNRVDLISRSFSPDGIRITAILSAVGSDETK